MSLYPSIPQNADLQALYEKLVERADKKVPSTDLIEMAEFILKSNFFKFETKIIQQISATIIGTKFAPAICVFIYGENRKRLSCLGSC